MIKTTGIYISYNTAVHKSTNYKSFEIMFNRKPKLTIRIFFLALNERETLTKIQTWILITKKTSIQKKQKEIYKIVKHQNANEQRKNSLWQRQQSR